jgi:hypothetical protein
MGNNATELEIYGSLGMSPMEAIQSTTGRAAEAIGMSKEIGTVEPGKLADIVAVDGNPLTDIKILQERKRIALVIKDGDICIDRRQGFLARKSSIPNRIPGGCLASRRFAGNASHRTEVTWGTRPKESLHAWRS